MLQNIRDRFTGIFAAIIIGTIAVALTITLVDTDTFTGAGNFAARVNGEEISLADFRQVSQQQVLEQEQLSQQPLTPEQRLTIEKNTLEGLVRNRVVAQYVQDAGYRISNSRIAEHIRSLPAFQVGGQFSADGYAAALAAQNVSTGTFESEQRAALQIEQLQNGLLESSFFTPNEYRRFITLEGERRRAAFAVLDGAALVAAVEPGAAQLQAYYDANPTAFESAESVALEFVEISVADFAPTGPPTDEELRSAYERQQDRFSAAEQRRSRHILVAVDQDTDDAAAARRAAALKARLDGGEDFAAVARAASDDTGSAQAGGDLGWAGRGTYDAAFEEALFGLQVGQVSPPVKTSFGYHIIELAEVRSGGQRSFEEAREELARELTASGAQDRFFAATEKMDDAALENPGSLAAVAAAVGRPVQRIEQFTRSGAAPFAANRAVIDAAFSAALIEDGENSSLIEAGEGRAVVLRVAEHRPVRLRPLAEMRDAAIVLWRRQEASRLVAERGRQLLERVRGGQEFAVAAAEAGATLVAPSQVLGRGAQEGPAELVVAIFRASRPAAGQAGLDGLSLADGRYAVFRLEEVIAGNPDEIPREQRDARKDLLARQAAVAEVTALAAELRSAASVVVAPTLFEQPEGL
jgi:peptidyl-prolyl cis-trans isomerase D